MNKRICEYKNVANARKDFRKRLHFHHSHNVTKNQQSLVALLHTAGNYKICDNDSLARKSGPVNPLLAAQLYSVYIYIYIYIYIK